jgi:hypothetical protein
MFFAMSFYFVQQQDLGSNFAMPAKNDGLIQDGGSKSVFYQNLESLQYFFNQLLASD